MLTTTEPTLTAENRLSDFVDAAWDVRGAVAAKYYEQPGRLDIRPLWSRVNVHYFRVNWWMRRENGFEQYIHRSAFVSVKKTESGFVVCEERVELAA